MFIRLAVRAPFLIIGATVMAMTAAGITAAVFAVPAHASTQKATAATGDPVEP